MSENPDEDDNNHITFWWETSPKSLPSGNKGSSPDEMFLQTHYNHKLKIISLQNVLIIKDNQVFLVDGVGNEWAGILGKFSCLN